MSIAPQQKQGQQPRQQQNQQPRQQQGQPRQQPGGISQALAGAGSSGITSPSSSPSISLVTPIPTHQIPVATSPTVDDTSVLTSSSPVYSGAHPFLRKFQTTVNKVLQQQRVQQQQQQQQQRAPEPSLRRASPTTEAAAVMDSILAKRVGHLKVNDCDDEADCKDGSQYNPYSTTAASASTPIAVPTGSASNNCNCGSSSALAQSMGEMDLLFDDDEDMRVEPSHFPPVSEEAREFSDRLLSQNKAWALKTEQERPGFFSRLEEQQKPQVLWIGNVFSLSFFSFSFFLGIHTGTTRDQRICIREMIYFLRNR